LAEIRTHTVLTPKFVTLSNSGTTTLVESDNTAVIFTGSGTSYTINMPNATTLSNGIYYRLYNTSSNILTIKDNAGTILISLSASSVAFITLEDNSTTAGTWIAWQSGFASSLSNYNVTSQTLFTTTSSTEVIITGFTVTPTAGTYSVWANSSMQSSGASSTIQGSLYKNGSQVADSTRSMKVSGSNTPMIYSTMSVIQFNGTDTCDLRVQTSSATLSVNNRSMLLIRLGS